MDFPTGLKPHLKRSFFSLFLNFSLLFLISALYTIPTSRPTHFHHRRHLQQTGGEGDNCGNLRAFSDRRSKCAYVKTNSDCHGGGYFNYLEIFYCSTGGGGIDSPLLGYFLLLLWLVVLFYVLGNTTAEYFCPSVEGLSAAMNLSPTIAGTTLLPLGNGANDVFSSVISFTGRNGGVGLSSVLGGALFITCFVVGVVSISVSSKRVRVDKRSFVRDVVFFLFVLCCLLAIMAFARVTLWFATCFMCLYFLYIGVVSFMHLFYKEEENKLINAAIGTPLLLGYVEEDEEKGQPLLLLQEKEINFKNYYNYWSLFIYIVELPLSLPRKLTIPLISEENWSKPFATISTTLAPILLATLCNTQGETKNNLVSKASLSIYLSSILVGIFLGALTLIFTNESGPPKRFRFPWLAGCFLMSIVWTYITVEELVSLMVSFGNILGISPAILGLTVLAWGNSLGDLISNATMALRGGSGGAQVAISGCYAGPLFNTLVGLGVSLVLAAWEGYPDSYPVPNDSDLYETVGFLMGGLLWAVVILPKRTMQLDKFLGVGLLTIYFCFLFLRVAKSVGLVNLGG
ncbi:hypothetical protein ACP275_10G150500 [Erythranthe tilingii]